MSISEKKSKKRGTKTQPQITISKRDLRILIFWAEYGVGNAKAGSYEKDIFRIITDFAQMAGMRKIKPELGKYLKSQKTESA